MTHRIAHKDWVVVADGEKALFLYNEGDGLHPNLKVFREMEQDNPPSREQGADRPGRLHDAGAHHVSAVSETDWHRIEKDRFAKEIADRLYRLAHQGAFKRLWLAAPPHVLGAMRKALHPEVADKITKEIPKTLTNHPVGDIEALIAE